MDNTGDFYSLNVGSIPASRTKDNMYYSKYRHLVSEEQYKIIAGSEWPSYHDFLRYKESEQPFIQTEMEELLGNEITNGVNEYKRQRVNRLLILLKTRNPILEAFIPAVICTLIYFYLGGTFIKFLGIGLIYYIGTFIYSNTLHRWFTHNQFVPKTWARYFLLSLIVLIGFADIRAWAKTHLTHHRTSDGDDDPHPARKGFWNTTITSSYGSVDSPFNRKLDPDIEFILNHYWILHIISLIILISIDIDLFLLSFLFFKSWMILTNGFINYYGHASKEGFFPRNGSNLTACITNGDNWHKNHHDDPRRFNQSDKGKLDFGYQIMKIFAKKK